MHIEKSNTLRKVLQISWLMLLLGFPFRVNAQSQVYPQMQASLGFFAESVALPSFQSYGGNIGLGGNLSFIYFYKGEKAKGKNQHFSYKYWAHKGIGAYHSFSSQFAYPIKLGKLGFAAMLGPTFFLLDPENAVYKYKNGLYLPKQLLTKFGAAVSFDVNYTVKQNVFYINYSLLVEYPFISPNAPILPHQMLEIGLRRSLHFPSKHEND